VSREGNGEIAGLKRKGITANWGTLRKEEIKIAGIYHARER
jgi:hypothetical protein